MPLQVALKQMINVIYFTAMCAFVFGLVGTAEFGGSLRRQCVLPIGKSFRAALFSACITCIWLEAGQSQDNYLDDPNEYIKDATTCLWPKSLLSWPSSGRGITVDHKECCKSIYLSFALLLLAHCVAYKVCKSQPIPIHDQEAPCCILLVFYFATQHKQ